MKLLGSPASPYARKTRMIVHIKGLSQKIQFVAVETADPDGSLRRQNPLGKIPVLVLTDGSSLYDSRVIAEYLDTFGAGPALFPEGQARWPALRCQALADGICDAALLQVYESRFRPAALRSDDWIAMQAGKVSIALDYLEGSLTSDLSKLTIGDVAVAATLGYLDLRFEGAWRNGHPKLAGWLERFADQVPAFAETGADQAF